MSTMEQLSGLDAAFLYVETPSVHGHVGALVVLDPSTAPEPTDFDAVRRLFENRLHLLPMARRRLVEVPLGLDHPYWVDDPDFDLEYHLRELALPPPGDMRQLTEQVARLAGRPLDRSRPLWEVYLISGLEGGRLGLFTKMHHCAIDGVSGAEVMAMLLDMSPDTHQHPEPDEPFAPGPVPGPLEMLGRGYAGLLRRPRRFLSFQRRAFASLGDRGQALRALPVLAATPVLANLGAAVIPLVDRFVGPRPARREGEVLERSSTPSKVPRTPFNHMVTPHRRVAFTSLPLDEVKAVKTAFGVTVNDVVMALCAGALRVWLVERGELPDDPLLAMVPVSVRTAEHAGTTGNQVSAMIAPLATDVADPAERLARIHEAMDVAKARHQAMPAEILQQYAEFATPALAARAQRTIAAARLAERVALPFNVVISNVPGPPFPLYLAGARVLATYPVSAIVDGVGLNITVMSYVGELHFGLTACRELVPDLPAMADGLGHALAELTKAAPA